MSEQEGSTVNVLHLCEHFGNRTASFHGVARSFELWIPALNQAPMRVWLCSRATPEAAALDRYQSVGIDPLWLGYNKLDPRNLFKLLRIIRRYNIHILHLHGFGACTWGRIAGHLCRIPAIVHVRCNYHTVPVYQRPVEWLLGPFTRYAFAVSESTREFTVKKRHIPDDRVKCLYSGIPMDVVPSVAPDVVHQLREAHGIGHDEILFGVVSRLEPHKGHFDVLDAFSGIQDERIKLWIIGDGYFDEPIAARIKELGLENRVLMLGYQADVWPWVHALDVQVFPSHREGTPNSLYEALIAGKAIVASNADGQGEILTDGKDALLYDIGDTEALRSLLIRIAADPALREQLSNTARMRAKDFDMARTLETLRETYRTIMEDKQ